MTTSTPNRLDITDDELLSRLETLTDALRAHAELSNDRALDWVVNKLISVSTELSHRL